MTYFCLILNLMDNDQREVCDEHLPPKGTSDTKTYMKVERDACLQAHDI